MLLAPYVAFLLSLPGIADDSIPDPQARIWQFGGDAVSYAVVYAQTSSNSASGGIVRVFIKNVSDSEKSLIEDYPESTQGIRLYYIDESGAKHLLHDHVYHPKPPFPGETPQEMAQERAKEIASLTGSVWTQSILRGQTISRDVALSVEDLALIKTQPVQCCFSIIDMKTGRQFEAQSSPEKLGELAPQPSAK